MRDMIDYTTESPQQGATKTENQNRKDETMSRNNNDMLTFKVGETYAARSICDHDCIFSAKVVRRTVHTVTFQEAGRGEYTCRINAELAMLHNCEAVMPHGRHSMAPVFTADKTLDAVEGNVYVAVYGTLMRGERNERWAREAGAEVVGEGTVLGWLKDTGWGYPAIECCGHLMRVAVEVLRTDAKGLAHMDILEGYPTLYGRETVTVDMADGTKREAFVYVMGEGKLPATAELIEPVDGVADWRKYRAGKEGR